MKKNDLAAVKKMDEKELTAKIAEARRQLGDLVLDKNIGKMKDIKSMYKIRKSLALYLTVLRQKRLLSEYERLEGGKK